MYFGSLEESKRVRDIAAKAYSTYASLQLLLAALQYDFADATETVDNEIEKVSGSDLLESCVNFAIDEVGGSVTESFQYRLESPVHSSSMQSATVYSSSEIDAESTATASAAKKKMMATLNSTATKKGKSRHQNIDTATEHGHLHGTPNQIRNHVRKRDPTCSGIKIFLRSGVTIESPIQAIGSCARWYSTIMDESRDLHLYHYDEEACVYSLKALEHVLQEGREVQHFFINIRGAVELLVQNVNQIDQNVMRAACSATHSLLLGNSITQQAFLKRGGMHALADCLHDYDIKVRLLALQNVAILCSDQEQCLDEVRKAGILEHVVSILNDFPADDVTIGVAIAAADVLAHCVNDNVANQSLVQNNNGLPTLFKVFRWCLLWRSTECTPGMQMSLEVAKKAHGIASVIENICAALSNLAYRNNSNQAEMFKNGTLALCISSLNNRAGSHFHGFTDTEEVDGVDAPQLSHVVH